MINTVFFAAAAVLATISPVTSAIDLTSIQQIDETNRDLNALSQVSQLLHP